MLTHNISAFIHIWNVEIHIAPQYIHIAPHYTHIQNVEMWWIHIASTFYVRRFTLHPHLKRYGHFHQNLTIKPQYYNMSMMIIYDNNRSSNLIIRLILAIKYSMQEPEMYNP